VKARFKSTNPELKIGMRGHPRENYAYKPLYNQTLDFLPWEKIQENNLILWQKFKNYDSLQKFFSNPPKEQIIAQYFYDLIGNYKIENYVKSEKEMVLDYSLRGTHVLYTYIKDEPLDFVFEKQDLNMYQGKDEFEINILKGEEIVHSLTIDDDGITGATMNKKPPQIAHIHLSDLNEGVYKIELKYKGTGSDSLITKITTKQKLLVVENQIFILGKKPSVLWTNATEASVLTWHTPQVLKINDIEEVIIDKINIPFSVHFSEIEKLNKIYSPENDIIISSKGFYSFSSESFFNPRPFNTVKFTEDTDLEDVDYIIAEYNLPKKISGVSLSDWLENEVAFDISNIEPYKDTIQFVIYAPNLKEKGGEVIIESLEITAIK